MKILIEFFYSTLLLLVKFHENHDMVDNMQEFGVSTLKQEMFLLTGVSSQLLQRL